MLELTISAKELYDESTGCFINIDKDYTIQMEHSLVAISKWESYYEKPFISSDKKKTYSEMQYYAKCMTLTENVPDYVYQGLGAKEINIINSYIQRKNTATVTKKEKPAEGKGYAKSKAQITSEKMYQWLVASEIPFEVANWNLNRMMALIDLCNEETKKASRSSEKNKSRLSPSRIASMNAERCKKYNTSG